MLMSMSTVSVSMTAMIGMIVVVIMIMVVMGFFVIMCVLFAVLVHLIPLPFCIILNYIICPAAQR